MLFPLATEQRQAVTSAKHTSTGTPMSTNIRCVATLGRGEVSQHQVDPGWQCRAKHFHGCRYPVYATFPDQPVESQHGTKAVALRNLPARKLVCLPPQRLLTLSDCALIPA